MCVCFCRVHLVYTLSCWQSMSGCIKSSRAMSKGLHLCRSADCLHKVCNRYVAQYFCLYSVYFIFKVWVLIIDTVFDLITALALITAPPPPTFHFVFTYYCSLDDLFLDFLLYFQLLSPTWRFFGTSSREQIYVTAPGAYYVEYGN